MKILLKKSKKNTEELQKILNDLKMNAEEFIKKKIKKKKIVMILKEAKEIYQSIILKLVA